MDGLLFLRIACGAARRAVRVTGIDDLAASARHHRLELRQLADQRLVSRGWDGDGCTGVFCFFFDYRRAVHGNGGLFVVESMLSLSHDGPRPVIVRTVATMNASWKAVIAGSERGIRDVSCAESRLVRTVASRATPKMAAWLCATIVLENVDARAEGNRLYVPASPEFGVADEVKSVITARPTYALLMTLPL